MAHRLGNVSDLTFSVPAGLESATGYRRAALVDADAGSVHTLLTLNELEPGGVLPAHQHSYETASFVLEGDAIVQIEGRAARLRPGGYAVAGVGTAHGWRNAGRGTLRWLDMSAPQPLPDSPADVSLGGHAIPEDAPSLDPSDPAPGPFGHFDRTAMPNPGAIPGIPIAYRGLVNESLGAEMLRTFIIELPPGTEVVLHDHPLEESYFLLEGECEITLADGRHPFRAGNFGWAGVGSPHAFHNTSPNPVRWLETQAPQPARRHAIRHLDSWRRTLPS